VSEVALALEAMATRFELVLDGGDPVRLRAAGEEALAEVARAEAQLSRFRATSDVAAVNAGAGGRPVRVDPRVAALLAGCVALARLTDGAFDVTVGPLVRAWGFTDAGGAPADPAAVVRARALVGIDGLEVDATGSTIRLARAGMELDLGAIGKGYAIDRAVAVLAEHDVPRALLHGGTSSVHCLGHPVTAGAWTVGWSVPGAPPEARRLTAARPALGVSAVHGRSFRGADGRRWGHVLDPRRGAPTQAAASACVVGAASTLCDALSTALLVHGASWRDTLSARFPGYEGWTAA